MKYIFNIFDSQFGKRLFGNSAHENRSSLAKLNSSYLDIAGKNLTEIINSAHFAAKLFLKRRISQLTLLASRTSTNMIN